MRHFKSDPLPDELIETIVGAGQRASTSSNLQTYSVIAVTDAARRDQIAQLCGNQDFIRHAPVFFAWCVDLARLDQVCAMRGYAQVTEYTENFLIATIDTALVAQNAALSAESLGLGICYVGAIRNHPREMIQLLDLPRLVFPIVGMAVGYPARAANPRPRLPLSAILHRDKYNRDQDAALHDYDRAMIATGIYENRQVAVPGKSDVMEEYGWLEHTARRVAQTTRAFLRAVLEEQGFALK
ncbi:MAG: NADPH-dependent oxidoreductase [Chloroflexi bacterium]|nr:NADPH-dependent oxidoreductase [Chloroflexota bacterium]